MTHFLFYLDIEQFTIKPLPTYLGRAEQSRAEQSRAEQSRAEQSRAEQSRAELAQTLPNSTDTSCNPTYPNLN